jgi:hypothetical protein
MCNTRKFLSPKCVCPVWDPFKCVSCNCVPHMCPMYLCTISACVPHINHHGFTQTHKISTIPQRTDRLVRDKDMSGPIISINCYGDGHLSCETVFGDTSWACGRRTAHRATLLGSEVCERPSVGGLRQKPTGWRTVFHGTCWCTRRGQLRAGQGEAPAERQLIA